MYKYVEDNRANAKKWYYENREKVLAIRRSPEWKERNKERRKRWYKEKNDERIAYSRKYDKKFGVIRRLKNRRLVLAHYSNGSMACACCGESNEDFLSLDHINNDGALHRKTKNKFGQNLYASLVRENYPDIGLQVLCYNCNMGRQFNMKQKHTCPHYYAQTS